MGPRTRQTYLSVRLHTLSVCAMRIALFCLPAFLFAVQAHAAGTFSTVGSMGHGRYYHSATLLNNGQVLIAGGCFPGANTLITAELYDPIAQTFSPTGNMTMQRCGQSATLLQDGRVLIAGGYGAGGRGPLSSAEIYDPSTGTFSPTGSMTMPRVYHVSALLHSGQVLIAGGYNWTGILSSAEVFDPSTGIFTPTVGSNMTTPREGSNSLLTPSAVLGDGTVLIAGGLNYTGVLSGAELFGPSSQTFTATTGNMTMPRWYHEVTPLQDGTVLLSAGGNMGGLLNTAETYDPTTGTFTATSGSLSTARIKHTATLLQDGTVLIAGGLGIRSVLIGGSELYDPSARTFSSAGNLQTARMLHTATLLQDGTVLIVGGYDWTNALVSAELYTPGRTASATFYISYSTGSNTNTGTSKSTPWKTHPYMQSAPACTGTGSAPVYTHFSGDKFVFMQGDSWPNPCFDMIIPNGGTPGNPDQYTFDSTWGSVPLGSGATTGNRGQIVGTYQFNAGGAVINGSDGINRFIYDNGNDNITINGVELTGVTWSGNGGGGDNVYLVDIQASQNFVLSNCYAHNWSYTNPVDGGDALGVFVGIGSGNYNAGSAMTGCVVDGSNSGGPGVANSGDATYAIPGCDNNIIMNVTNGCLVNANASVHDNIIGPINQSFSAFAHENCIEPIDPFAGGTSTVYIYNNVIHDCTSSAILTQGTPATGSNEIDYIWNNVIYVGSVPNPPIPIQLDTLMSPNTGSEAHVWNNTIYAGPSAVCVRTLNEGNGNYSVLDLQNNFCISDQGFGALLNPGNTETINNNVVMATKDAVTAGLASSQPYAYQPTAPDCGGVPNCPVGAGTNLLIPATGNFATLANDTTYGGQRSTHIRPTSGTEDAGAYQY